MNSTRNYWIFGAILAIALWFALCSRKPTPTEPTQPEQQRQRIITGRETKDKELAVDTMRYLAATKAAKQEADYWQAKYLSATKKGSGIEQRYLKNKNIATCDTLLANKEERITDLLGNLEAVKKDTTAKSVLIKDLAGHVKDRNLRIDTLDNGWKAANLDNAKKDKKIKNRNKLIKILGAAVAVLVGVIAVK